MVDFSSCLLHQLLLASKSKAARAASQVLRDGRTGKASKTAAGSALSQKPPSKRK
jgi:hypothetical protein